jgi:hypothetical protein
VNCCILSFIAGCSEWHRQQLTKVRHVFMSKTRTTWIELVPLDFNALSALVSTTLQRPKDDVAPLTRLVHRVSIGNPFSARNLLITVRRQGHVSSLFSSTACCLRAAIDMVRVGSQHLEVRLGPRTGSNSSDLLPDTTLPPSSRPYTPTSLRLPIYHSLSLISVNYQKKPSST